MRRPYNLSPEGKAALVKTAAHAREVRASRDPVDAAVSRIERHARAKGRLMPELAARLSALLASAPSTAETDS